MMSQSLFPTLAELVTRARGDISMGLPCLLGQGDDTVLMAAVETLPEPRFAELCRLFGAPELVITANRARAVMTDAAATNLPDGPVRILPPEGAGFDWYQGIADTQSAVAQSAKGPLHVLRGCDPLAPKAGLGLVKSAELLPAVCLFRVSIETDLASLPFVRVTAQDVLEHLARAPLYAPVAKAFLPTEDHDVTGLQVFRDPSGTREHYAITIGHPQPGQPVLTRLHSACFTGDVLGSLKCDCGPQLRAALARMGEEGAGVLLYLNQEGRGIGLANKMRVYALQSQGLDTVEANHQLGFDDDERDFRTGATILRRIGVTSVRLLTNNPNKVDTLSEHGIEVVDRLPLAVGRNIHNHAYLSVKALKSGHYL